MWIPTALAPGLLLPWIGLIDALISAMLVAATSVETTYIGMTSLQCAQIPRNGTADQRLIFFERARATNITNPDLGEDLCREFLVKFKYGIGMA
jgi:hypothetical protein